MPSSASNSKARSSRKRSDEGAQLSLWDVAPAPEPAPAPRKRREKPAAAPLFKVLDPEVSGLVGNEILEGRLQPAEWAMALANSSGSRDEAVTHYARIRLQSLADETHQRRQKRDALEFRRSSGFQKLPPEPPPLARINQRRGLHPFWLGSMWLAVSGACASAVRLFLADSPLFIAHAGIAPHIAFGAVLVCIAVALHFVIPRVRMLLWQVLPVATCLTAIASFGFGVRILQRSVFETHQNSHAPLVKSAPVQSAPDDKLFQTAKSSEAKELATAP